MNAPRESRRLSLAAVLAGAVGLALIALGWWIVGWEDHDGWGSLSDPTWWAGDIMRALGFAAIGKTGFKAALVCIAGAVAAVAWLRAKRRGQSTPEITEAATDPAADAATSPDTA